MLHAGIISYGHEDMMHACETAALLLILVYGAHWAAFAVLVGAGVPL